MKAITYTEYGQPEVLRIEDLVKPVPKEKEILVKVKAASVNYGDLIARKYNSISPGEFNMPFLFWLLAKIDFGLSKPKRKVLGSEFSGEIESIGKDVKSFKVGDKVFGYLGQKMGAYAEYLSLSENGTVAHLPENITFEEAAVVPYGSIMAFGLLEKLNIQPGQSIMIIGASGSIGSAAVQLVKISGANVTGVCGTNKVEYVKALGADSVIDYRKEDYTKCSEKFDFIFDVLGKSSISKCKGLLKPGGIHFFVSFKSGVLFQMLITSLIGNKKVRCSLAPGSAEHLKAIKILIEEKEFKPAAPKTFSMGNIVEAHKIVEAGNNNAGIAITMQ